MHITPHEFLRVIAVTDNPLEVDLFSMMFGAVTMEQINLKACRVSD